MKYVSTRSTDKDGVTSAYAIKTGLAGDGGLYMPETIPSPGNGFFESLIEMSYTERAVKILSLYLTDYTTDELTEDVEGAYSESKFGANPAPVSYLDEKTAMLELWHGPTSAFKDMALQLMPRLFVRALRKCNETRKALILVATSGDTGKAALEGYRDVPGTAVKVFYPTDGVSRVQKLQMQTQEGDNLSVVGIEGNFDDAQNGVKRIFGDPKMAKELDELGVFLSSANSINWGRLVPQIVYYVSAYCDLVKDGRIRFGDPIDVCVPTGNFGNIFGCYIAKKMGLPVGRLICASNSNNVLTDFFKTGTYDRNRPFFTTVSPSMDILISSNLERLLYITLGPYKTREYMKELASNGRYALEKGDLELIKSVFSGYYTDEEGTKKTVKDVFENKKHLIDTHTAVAVHSACEYRDENEVNGILLVVSTASAYKFAKDVYGAITGVDNIDGVEALDALSELTGVEIPIPLANLTNKKIRHGSSISKEDMDEAVREFAKN